MSCAARRDGDAFVLDGEKIWISNGGIADVYTVVCPHRRGARHARHLGLRGVRRHAGLYRSPSASRPSRRTRSPVSASRIAAYRPRSFSAAPGEGFKIAMRTLDIFRPSVAAAALGFARRALDEAVAHARIAKDVRRDAGRSADGAEHAGRNGDRDRCGGTSDRAHRLAARCAEAADDARGSHGQDDGDRKCAMGHRPGAAAFRRHAACASARSPNASIGRFVRCASTKGPPKSRNSSSAAS